MIIFCEKCGKEFYRSKSLVLRAKRHFCSKECYCSESLTERFSRQITKSEGCWEWAGKTKDGYGHIYWKGHHIGAHRVSWMIHFGEIPEGLYVCHHCDNRKCTNPDHLFLGTHQDNMTDCKNTGIFSRSGGVRGSAHHASILTENDVLEIRKLYRPELRNMKTVGEKFGVSKMCISGIICGRLWRHVK